MAFKNPTTNLTNDYISLIILIDLFNYIFNLIGDSYSILKDNDFSYVAPQHGPKLDDKIINKIVTSLT